MEQKQTTELTNSPYKSTDSSFTQRNDFKTGQHSRNDISQLILLSHCRRHADQPARYQSARCRGFNGAGLSMKIVLPRFYQVPGRKQVGLPCAVFSRFRGHLRGSHGWKRRLAGASRQGNTSVLRQCSRRLAVLKGRQGCRTGEGLGMEKDGKTCWMIGLWLMYIVFEQMCVCVCFFFVGCL